MRGRGFLDAVELDQHDALAQPFVVSLGGVAAGEKTPAAGTDRRPSELGVFGERVRVGNRKVGRNPVSLGHHCLANCFTYTNGREISGPAYGRRGC
jgi:hypothetical protein